MGQPYNWPSPPAILLNLVFEHLNRAQWAVSVQVQVLVTAAPHDEYDDALRRAPHLCRPFAAAAGDVRSAAECVDGCAELCSNMVLFVGAGIFCIKMIRQRQKKF